MNEFQLWAPAQPVREHVQKLRDFGIGLRQISLLANVRYQVVKTLMSGHSHTRGQQTQRIMAESARRLLQIQAKLENVAPNKLVDSKATQRRIQALCAIGYSFAWQGEMIGSHARTLLHVLRNSKTTRDIHDRVEKLFNTYAYTPNVAKSELERRGITKTKQHAKRNGWVSAANFDQAITDDIEVGRTSIKLERRLQIAIRGVVAVTILEHEYPTAVERLSAQGLTQKQIASILKCSEVTIRNIKNKKGHKWNREFTAQNSASTATSSQSRTIGSGAPASA